jgi:PAS domain S-box-containing protein
MSAAQANPGSVLIVTTHRDDRRVLFDTLDAQNFEAVYTAKDLPQALAFLEQDPQIDVVVMEFLGEAREAVAFCTQLKGDARLAKVPVIGIAAADATQRRWDWSRTPAGVVDWLRSPVDASEALARVRNVLAADAGTKTTGAGRDRYQFAFEDSLDEIVLSDPKTGSVIDANATFEQRSGFSRAQVIGQALDSLDASHDRNQRAALLATLAREGSVQYRCNRRRGDGGSRAVEAHMRLAVQDGRLVHVTVFREPSGGSDSPRYKAALGMIAAAAECGGGDEGMNQVVSRCIPTIVPACRRKRRIR